jgi:hypothetical protein
VEVRCSRVQLGRRTPVSDRLGGATEKQLCQELELSNAIILSKSLQCGAGGRILNCAQSREAKLNLE